MKRLKFLLIVATLICAITALCVCANAATYSGECGADGDNLTWTLNTTTGVLEIDGTGAMKNWSSIHLFRGIPTAHISKPLHLTKM